MLLSTLKQAIYIGASILVVEELTRLAVLLVVKTRSLRGEEQPLLPQHHPPPAVLDYLATPEDKVSPRQFAKNVSLVLFYNVFVPAGNDEAISDAGVHNNGSNNNSTSWPALEIVRDHLAQMRGLFRQFQRTGRTRQTHLPVHFVTIGSPRAAFAVMQMCHSPLTCLHQDHYDAGYEEVTLQVAYEYCADENSRRRRRSRRRIIYLHNKGSLHPDYVGGANGKNTHTISQNAWRQHGTAGAMHPDCLDPPDRRCNLCGLYIEVVPTIRQPYVRTSNIYTIRLSFVRVCVGVNIVYEFSSWFPFIWPSSFLSVRGNFWSASCDYVRQLIPPNEFAMAQDAMYEALLKMQQQMNDSDYSDNVQGQQQQRPQQQQLPPILLQNDSFWVPRPASLGLGRFANEVWIGSHPDVIPCDVSPATSFTLYKTDTTDDSIPEMQFGMLPKRTFDEIVQCDDIGNRERKHNVMQNETRRKRDFFLLPGMLFQSSFRYQSLPLNTSWVFDQYPDGPYWRRQAVRMRLEIEPAA
jgi:hypothetical protein